VTSTRPAFKYLTEPRKHQVSALEKMGDKHTFGLFMDVGTGKSWTTIAVMGRRFCAGESDHALIISKNGVQIQWVAEQIPLHLHHDIPFKTMVYRNSSVLDKNLDQLLASDGLKIFAMNVESIATPTGFDAAARFLRAANGSGAIYLDESQTIKSAGAKRTRAALRLAKLAKYRMILTGTPISKDVVDLYSQLSFLDHDILGTTRKADFIRDYCVTVMTPFGEEIIGQKNVEVLQAKMDPHIFRITSAEALDLPPKVYDQIPFELSEEQLHLIRQIKNDYYTSDAAGESTVSNAAAALTRIQQVSCGFLPLDDGTVRELPNPRLEALLSLLEQREGKAIIWCRFNEDIKRVWQALSPLGVHYFGKTSPADRETALSAFMDPDSGIRYLIANPEAAGTGLNLQGACQTNVYYSNSFNALSRWQSEGRTWRDGTTGSVTYFDLVANRSPDKRVLKNLSDKKSISDLNLDEYREIMK
jgi:hypothetical protein